MQNPVFSHVRHPVVFTGAEADYQRLWRRHALLCLLTLGMSLPWAMVSTSRYFYQHTRIAGHGLDYHANPMQMFWGNLVGSVLINGLYFAVSKTGSYALVGWGALQITMALLTPLMLHGLLQFKLAHTSWRGQRLALVGKPLDAVKAMGVPTLIYLASAIALVWAVVVGRAGQSSQAWGLGLLGMAGLSVALPFMQVRFKAYQHRHAVMGPLTNEQPIDFNSKAVLGACLRATGMAMALLLLVVLPLALGLSALAGFDPAHAALIPALVVVVPSLVVGAALMTALPYTYLSVQLQNQLWSQTAHAHLRFESQVPLRPVLWLTLRNWLLIVGTLGWYYPRASVAHARLRLQSVSVWLKDEAGADRVQASSLNKAV